MTWNFADGFDLYAAGADMLGYWDVNTTNGGPVVAGRFPPGQAYAPGSSGILQKVSGVNDAVHHFVLSFAQQTVISAQTTGLYIELFDGATAQCSIVFAGNGSITLMSGGPAGTVLATYANAYTLQAVWYAFEIEVVIHPTAGSFTIRKNGNNLNDFTLGGLNTRPVSTNNYANKIQLNTQGGPSQYIDDFFWQSGAVTGNWLGDIRCYTRMPVTDASVQFSRSPTTVFSQPGSQGGGNTQLQAAGNIRWWTHTCKASGTVASISFNCSQAVTGHTKFALYDSTGAGGSPGNLLGQFTEIVNMGLGLVVTPISGTAPAVVRSGIYWIASWSDMAGPWGFGSPLLDCWQAAVTYTGTFPATAVSVGATHLGTGAGMGSGALNITTFNANNVSDPQQDGTATYNYDSNPGDADFYNIAGIPGTPAVIFATVVRGYALKSDAGTRTLNVQMKSGATTVVTPTIVLTTSGFLWTWRMDLTDPNTGAAWTPAAVNLVQIGPKVIA